MWWLLDTIKRIASTTCSCPGLLTSLLMYLSTTFTSSSLVPTWLPPDVSFRSAQNADETPSPPKTPNPSPEGTRSLHVVLVCSTCGTRPQMSSQPPMLWLVLYQLRLWGSRCMCERMQLLTQRHRGGTQAGQLGQILHHTRRERCSRMMSTRPQLPSRTGANSCQMRASFSTQIRTGACLRMQP